VEIVAVVEIEEAAARMERPELRGGDRMEKPGRRSDGGRPPRSRRWRRTGGGWIVTAWTTSVARMKGEELRGGDGRKNRAASRWTTSVADGGWTETARRAGMGWTRRTKKPAVLDDGDDEDAAADEE
jgi:hypothetical protein